MSKRILLVEDEEHIMEVVKLNLEMEGYKVSPASDGKAALDVFAAERFDLIILDVMLPVMDGFKVCETIRLRNTEIPILFLTAKDSSDDRIRGLKKGGDDYLTKPFNLEELLLRVEKLILRSNRNRHEIAEYDVLEFGGNTINLKTLEAKTFSGKTETLTLKEVTLLKFLSDRKQQAVSRDEILETVWGYDIFPSTRTIDNFMVRFRKLFEKDPRHPLHFHSVRGIGYKFTE